MPSQTASPNGSSRRLLAHPFRSGGKTEDVSGPNKVLLQPGDALVETSGLVHYVANDTDQPVVIELAALLERGAPLATPVGTAATGRR